MTHRLYLSRGGQSQSLQTLHFVGPLPDDAGSVGGVGLYHQKFIDAVAALAPSGCELIVHSQKSRRTLQPFASSNIRVFGTWQSGLHAVVDLWKLVFVRPGDFLLQFEVQLFGSVIVSLLLPPLIVSIRSRGSRVFVLMHHIISPNLNSETLKDWKTPSRVDAMALTILRANQWLIAKAANAVIVHEQAQADMLRATRAYVVPHGVSVQLGQSRSSVFPDRALRVALFGFIAPYKGSLEAVEAVLQLLNEGLIIELNIVGGEHPRMRKSADYHHYVSKLRALTELRPELTMKGYVPASDLDAVLLENDLVVLPYKSAIGVSGALSYAIGLGLPVAVSSVLGKLMELPMDIPRFDPSAAGIAEFLRRTIIDRQLPAIEPIRALATTRSWTAVGQRVWDLLRSAAL